MPEAKEITLNFQNADLLTVLQLLAPRLELNYVVEPSVPGGRVTIQMSGKFTKTELLAILLTILEMNNLAMIKSGQLYRIAPLAEARQRPIDLLAPADPGAIPLEDRPAMLLISPQHVPASSVEPLVRPLLSKAAMLQVVPGTNVLLLVELASNARRLFELIQLFDTPAFDRYQVKLYPVRHASPEDLARELEELFGQLGYGKGKEVLNFLPMTRLGSVLVINSFPQLRSQIERWMEALDQQSQGDESIFVYYVENGKASNIARILSELYQLAAAGPPRPPGFPPISLPPGVLAPPVPPTLALPAMAPPAPPRPTPPPPSGAPPRPPVPGAERAGPTGIPLRIIADDETNALIIVTNPRFYPTVMETIKKLDMVKRQAVIETMIAEISLDDLTKFGLEYSIRTTGKVRVGSNEFDFKEVTLAQFGTLGVPQAAILGLSAVVTANDRLTSLLQALSEANRIRVLASPHVLATDNKPAVINIGDSIPILTSQTSTAQVTGGAQNLTQTIQYRDTGVILRVTPHINEKRNVVLDIAQEVSSAIRNTVGGTESPIFQIRKAETSASVADGQTVLIGGLIQEQRDNLQRGIPLLSKLPVLGYLFRSTTVETKRRELIILITPRVIANEDEAKSVTESYIDRVKLLQEEIRRGRARPDGAPPKP
jgi:general secretion pathway protein D